MDRYAWTTLTGDDTIISDDLTFLKFMFHLMDSIQTHRDDQNIHEGHVSDRNAHHLIYLHLVFVIKSCFL